MYKYYRPEWTCGRYDIASRSAIMYNLLEGDVYLFQDITADLINLILNTKKGDRIDINNISKELELNSNTIIDFFDKKLITNKLVTNKKYSNEEIFEIRLKSTIKRKSNFSNKTVLKLKSNTHGDVQDEYQSILKNKSIPFNVVFELTYNCNERCIHCYNPGAARNSSESNNRKTNELTTSDYKKIIVELKELGVVRAVLTGGDPFMRKDIWELIEMLYENDFAIEIKTNGLGLLGNELRLSSFYPYEVSFSVYSGIPETHDRITSVKGSLIKTIKCIENLSKLAINVKLCCVIMNYNAKDYYTTKKISEKYGYAIVYDLKLSNAYDKDYSITQNLQIKGEILEIILRDKCISLYVDEKTSTSGIIKKRKEDSVCAAGVNLIGINPEGDVLPCHTFPMVLGSLKTDTIQSILESENRRNWVNNSNFENFEICGTKDFCDYCTLCVGENYIDNNNPYKPNSVSCYIAKTRMKVAKNLVKGIDPLNGKTLEGRLIEFDNIEILEFKRKIKR